MGKHAKFSPSASSRWMNCPGSIPLSAKVTHKGRESFAAKEGTVAHEVCERALFKKISDAKQFIGTTIDGIEVTDEMVEAVNVYLDTVWSMYGSMPSGAVMLVERRLDMKFIHPSDCFGTADCIIYHPQAIAVIDYKHGKGIPVDAVGNTQTVCYGLGALETYSPFADIVENVIVQPRAPHKLGPVRNWELSSSELYKLAEPLRDATANAESDNPTFKAGSWCRWCPCASQCPVLADKALHEAKQEFAQFTKGNIASPPTVSLMKPEEIRAVLDNAELIKGWLKEVEDFVLEKLESGGEFPGWGLKPKRATRKWQSENTAMEILDQRFEPHDLYNVKIKTPAQVEKMIDKDNTDLLEIVDDLQIRVSSGNNLVQITEEVKKPEEEFSDFVKNS